MLLHKMYRRINHHFINKVAALLIGYSIWFTLHNEQTIHLALNVPVQFINADFVNIKAPETTMIDIQSKRKYIKQLLPDDIVLHVDLQKYSSAQTLLLQPDASLLRLPKNINVISYKPIIITITEK